MFNITDPSRLAMLNAGLGMMANSTGPNSGNAFGLGLQQGVQSYQNSLAQQKQEELLKKEQEMKQRQFEQQSLLRQMQIDDIVKKQQAEKSQKEALQNIFTPLPGLPGKGGQVERSAYAPPTDARGFYNQLIQSGQPALAMQGIEGLSRLQPAQKTPKFGTKAQEINGKMVLFADDGTMREVGNAPQQPEDIQDKFRNERDLRKEWAKYQDAYADAGSNHDKLIKALSANNGIGDTAAIFSFMKALDPGSVVRGEEQEMVMGAGGIMEQMNSIMAKYKEGELLPAGVRRKIAQLSQDYMAAAAKSHATTRQDYARIVDDYKFNPANVLRTPLPTDIYNQDFSGMFGSTTQENPLPAGISVDDIQAEIERRQRQASGQTSYATNQRRR